jgi:predicted negative regulator of RcsB-dependent stress response
MKSKRRKAVVAAVLGAGLLAPPPARSEEPDPSKILNTVQAYLSMLDRMEKIASDPRSALMLAQNSIKEVYERKGQKAEAVGELRKLLDGLEDVGVRTAIRFAIADIYKETGQNDRALEELRMIVSENKAVLARKR